ncbi:MAG: serine hydrolase domain-containing protein [Geminicoccaceae bacterium]
MPVRYTVRVLGLTVLLSLFAVTTAPSAQATNDWAGKKRTLDVVLTEAIKRYDIPGAVVGVWTPEGRWIATRGFADIDRRIPVRAASRFGIRSITKSFTVTIILQLAAEGKLRLDDKVARYVAGVPNGHRITLRQLANMTSGLVDYSKVPAFFDRFATNFARRWTNEELLRFAFRAKPLFDPGTRYDYSNTNTVLLGVIAERVTGRPFAKVIERRILDRLKLADTRYLSGSSVPPPRALNYLYDEDTDSYFSLPVSFTSQGPAGALSSDLDDLRRWGVALVDGKLLPPALQRQRFAGRPPTNGPEYDQYGLGMGELNGFWGHTGSGLGYQALVMHHPKRHETVVILINTSRYEDIPAHIFRRLARILAK